MEGRPRIKSAVTASSDRIRPPVAGADADRLLDIEHEDLAIADTPRARCILDRLDRIVGEAVLDHHLDLYLGQEVDDIFGAAIKLGVALLAAEALDLRYGDSRHANVVQCILHVVELEGLDDRFDLL